MRKHRTKRGFVYGRVLVGGAVVLVLLPQVEPTKGRAA